MVIVAFSPVTTPFLDAYSAGISFHVVFSGIKEKAAGVAVCAIGTMTAIFARSDSYENLLYLISSVFAPMAAVMASSRTLCCCCSPVKRRTSSSCWRFRPLPLSHDRRQPNRRDAAGDRRDRRTYLAGGRGLTGEIVTKINNSLYDIAAIPLQYHTIRATIRL